jgi:four helix bundle protein
MDENMDKSPADPSMRSDPLREKSMRFAVRIVKLNHWLREEHKEFALADQILRSGTSIGANLAEAVYAPSSRDFLNKNKIALKECSETIFWLDLLHRSELISDESFSSLYADCTELRKMLSSACKTTEERIQDK